MTSLSPNERDLIRALVDAFRSPQLSLSSEQIAARGVRFVEELAASGSDRVDQIRLTLAVLDATLNFIDRSDRMAVRGRLTELENGSGAFGLLPKVARDLARFAQRLAFILIYGTLDSSGTGRRPASPSATKFSRTGLAGSSRRSRRNRCFPGRSSSGRTLLFPIMSSTRWSSGRGPAARS